MVFQPASLLSLKKGYCRFAVMVRLGEMMVRAKVVERIVQLSSHSSRSRLLKCKPPASALMSRHQKNSRDKNEPIRIHDGRCAPHGPLWANGQTVSGQDICWMEDVRYLPGLP